MQDGPVPRDQAPSCEAITKTFSIEVILKTVFKLETDAKLVGPTEQPSKSRISCEIRVLIWAHHLEYPTDEKKVQDGLLISQVRSPNRTHFSDSRIEIDF